MQNLKMKWSGIMNRFVCLLFAGVLAIFSNVHAQKLMITGVTDGPLSGGTPKVVELYASDNIKDLSQYGLGIANNGNGSDGEEFTFPEDSIEKGTYIFITNNDSVFDAFYDFEAHYESGIINQNGDDAVELFMNGTAVDVYGQTDQTGASWNYEGGWAYRNNNQDTSIAFNADDWTITADGLLNGNTNKEVDNPFPAGYFSPANATFFMTAKGSCQLTGDIFDEGATEIPAYEPGIDSIYFTSGTENAIMIASTAIDNPVLEGSIDLSPYGDGVTSVAIKNGIVAAAVERADSSAQQRGYVVFFDKAGHFLDSAAAGYLPDMVTFTPSGDTVLLANEGEPNEDYTYDPEGSISIIGISGDPDNFMVQSNNEIRFNGLDSTALTDKGVRIYGPDASVAQDLEPEYIAVSPAGDSAFVTLQENNAILAMDLSNPAITEDNIQALGYKDHSIAGNGFDPSNEDNKINIQPRPVWGMYQPDAIVSYEVNGKLYYITANEGDARDYDGYSEETSVEDVILDADNFPDAAGLQTEEGLGDVDISSAMGDHNEDDEYDSLFTYGARSFSIWEGATGNQVYDSKNAFETITANMYPYGFNSDNANNAFDDRSDAKGPEPEGIAIGTVKGKTYAFIGLERIGGIMVYDVTDPANPVFETYFNNRDFKIALDEDEVGEIGPDGLPAGDLGPEGLVFIPPGDPNDYGKIAVTHEVSGNVRIFAFKPNMPAKQEEKPEGTAFSLTLLHNNDAESGIVGGDLYGGAATFKTYADSAKSQAENMGHEVLMLSSGDNFLAGKQFDASLNRDPDKKYYDAIVIDSIGYDALAIGNHDFDFGPGVLSKFITDANISAPPFLSANLDFSGADTLNQLTGDRIKKSHIVTKGGEEIGIIGATTPDLASISSPAPVTVQQAVADSVMAQVEALNNEGVNKIIVISHLQGINNDTAMIKNLQNVDIVIAGGGDELLANENNDLMPGDTPAGPYPVMVEDAQGDSIPVVTTSGNYEYLGRLITYFDNNGNLLGIGDKSGPIAVFKGNTRENEGLAAVADSIKQYTADIDSNNIAHTEVRLDGQRANIRTMETNFGNLIADAMLWQANIKANERGVDTADIALQNGGGIRNSVVVNAGDSITEGNTYDALPFGNTVVILRNISTTTLLYVLENAISNTENTDGRFAQISGFRFTWNPYNTAMEIDEHGNITRQGSRVRSVLLNDGTVLVANGNVVKDTTLSVATNNFTAEGGDQYPWDTASYDDMVIAYQKAIFNYLIDPNALNGSVTAAMYPEGGQQGANGRIIKLDTVFNKHFDDHSLTSGGWLTYDAAGAQDWKIETYQGDTTAFIHNYDGNDAPAVPVDDWLISPEVDFSALDEDHYFSFVSRTRFNNGNYPLDVLYSTDYAGAGHPENASWHAFSKFDTATSPAAGTGSLTPSGNIALDTINGQGHIAFRFAVTYPQDTTTQAGWEVDSIMIMHDPITENNSVATNADKFKVYPNPSGNKVHVKGTTKIAQLKLYDAKGHIIKSRSYTTARAVINVSGYAAGIYHLVVIDKNGETRTFRLLVQ